jgi:hypothetical protein
MLNMPNGIAILRLALKEKSSIPLLSSLPQLLLDTLNTGKKNS